MHTLLETQLLPVITDWDHWSQLFLNVDIWYPIVEHICQKHNIAQCHKIEAGFPGTCAVFVVDRRVVVKLYPPMLPEDFYKERSVYQTLQGQLPQMVELLAHGIVQDRMEWPYLCLEFRTGQAIRELRTNLMQKDHDHLAVALGKILQTVHRMPLNNLDHFDLAPAVWLQFLQERQRVCLDELREEIRLDERVLGEIKVFLTKMMPRLLQSSKPLHLINADLTEDHLLLSEGEGQGWQISALIDWADAEIGTAEYEWVALWFSLCNRNQQMFCTVMERYDPDFRWDEHFCQHMLAYTLLHRFSAGIVGHIWRADGEPDIHSVSQLQNLLWPSL